MDSGERGVAGDVRLLALAFTAGVLALHALSAVPALGLLLVLLLSVLPRWRGRAYWAAAVLGFVLSVWHARQQLELRWPESRFNEEITLRGAIASLPELARLRDEKEQEQRIWRFRFEPEDGQALPAMRVSWYGGPEALQGGSCWQLKLRVRAPHGSLNPQGFDYEGWLYRQHLGATATVREAQPCGAASGHFALKARQAFLNRIAAVLGTRQGANLLAALSVGATGGLRDADWDVLRLTGTTHLMAISGFNLALVAGMAWWLLRWLWPLWPRAAQWQPAQRVAGVGALLLAALYAVLAGFEAPVARALFMLALALAASGLDRPLTPSRLLALAWIAVLLPDPCVVLLPGLWLSFAAVAAIFYLSSARWRREVNWRAALRIQLFLTLALAPLGLFYFHGFSLSALPVNLLAVPVFALLTPLVLLGMMPAMLSAAAAGFTLPALAWLLEQVFAGLGWCAQQGGALWWPAAPAFAALLLAALGALLLFAPARLPLQPLGLICFAPLLLQTPQPLRGALELTVLDVGQGLSVLVRTARHALLFDAGPAYEEGFDAGASVVAPYVLGLGLRELDLLLLSHGDLDHAGGVPAVRRLLRVRHELGTPGALPCRDGQRWDWDGVHFEVLHPGGENKKRNDNSCVLKIQGPFGALLPGDIEKNAERQLLLRHQDALRSEVLLAPHHGSRSSSTPEFVAAVAPQVVVFPAGWHNRFAHPRPEVVQRYGACGSKASMWLSGESGALEIFQDEAGVLRQQPWRASARHFWNARPQAQAYWREPGADCAP
ncbi:competence protein ComEC [Solimonas aquatica]|uniref:Competence protein ComEC n=1 Tax=Solimonas aquatica TaxID=489703 RepID=A0A1H9CI08_9GAMM|nr:competence protein ComEC [Solimonas aquatica]